MVAEGPTPGPPLPHDGPESVPVFTAKRPVWSGKRKEVFKKSFLFYETLPCLEKYVVILESEEESGFFSKLNLRFSWLRPPKMLGIISLVQYMSRPLLCLGKLCLKKSLQSSKTNNDGIVPVKV